MADTSVENEGIKFLIEIVGCEDLTSADCMRASDPYVEAKFNGVTLHKTDKHDPKTLNPVYTLRNESFFIWETSTDELFFQDKNENESENESENERGELGLQLTVHDFDAFGGHDLLGVTVVPSKDLYEAKEERLTYALENPTAPSLQKNCGTISIRCRRATEYDEDFMKRFREYKSKGELSGVLVEDVKSEKKKREKDGGWPIKVIVDRIHGIISPENKKIIPKQGPDDSNGTESMTEEDIVMQPSHQYISIGSGNIAKVYLEILGCDDLPNMEGPTSIIGNKTDAFVKIVYEDCICQTDVISNNLSPRFLPRSKRAFVFHTNYPSSVINLGVFDFDPGMSILNKHDFIGRAAVDVMNLRPGTEYMLNYALYDSALKAERKQEGRIKIRIRVEVEDPRKYLLAGLSLPPKMYVSSKTPKDFHCVRLSCNGKRDMNRYSIETIVELVSELIEQGQITFYIGHYLVALSSWKVSRTYSILGKEIGIPLHSMYAFFMAITVVEYPGLLPSYFLFTLGWLLTKSMQWRIDNPNLWNCPTFHDLCLALIFGKRRPLSPESIAASSKVEEDEKGGLSWEDLFPETAQYRLEQENKAAKEAEKDSEKEAEIAKEQEELERELEEAGGTGMNIVTETGGVVVDPILLATKKSLYPIQQTLLSICDITRFVRNIVLWEESVYSFWVTFTCFSLSVVLLFIPWGFIFQWLSRIIVWTLFGPWMAFFQRRLETKESELKQEEAERSNRRRQMEKTINETRVRNEILIKLRDFKQYLFGKFITMVPILKCDRHIDQPLSTSSAKPVEGEGVNIHTQLEIGQHLTGLMIPKIREPVCGAEIVQTNNVIKKLELQRLSMTVLVMVMIHVVVPLLIDGLLNATRMKQLDSSYCK